METYINNSDLLFEKNKTKKNHKGTQLRGIYAYELHMERYGDINLFEDSLGETNIFLLTTLKEIISFVEERLKKGVKSPIIFYSRRNITMADNFTVSLTEYVIYYYHMVKGVDVYITQGILSKEEFNICTLPEEDFLLNGFFVKTSTSGFMLTSFLVRWYPFGDRKVKHNHNNEELTNDFFLKNVNGRRYKTLVGQGPWDASIAISECQDYLQRQGVTQVGIDAVMDVVGELVPNAIEHGATNCILDVSCEEFEALDEKELLKGTNVSVVIFDFSEKLLWTALRQKIFVDFDEYGYQNKIDRIKTVKKAWNNHEKQFDEQYSEYDFYNVMAFQKISGRKGDRIDGGLGINTLIKRVQEFTRKDFCYVLSGNRALSLDSSFTDSDKDGYIGFNTSHDFVGQIPDKDAVMNSKFYMPGVAYNLCFNFFKEE